MQVICWFTALVIAVTCSTSFGEEFDVVEFGAVADGRTDCTAAIQGALESAGKAGGGRVVIPAAEQPYVVTQTVKVAASNIQLVGEGATLKLADNAVRGSQTHVLLVGGSQGQKISNVTIRGLTMATCGRPIPSYHRWRQRNEKVAWWRFIAFTGWEEPPHTVAPTARPVWDCALHPAPYNRGARITMTYRLAIYHNPHDFTEPYRVAITIGEYGLIDSRILGDKRRVWVHLPETYHSSEQSYPVLHKCDRIPAGALNDLARNFMRQDKPDEALGIYRTVMSDYKEKDMLVTAMLSAGRIYASKGMIEEAIECYERLMTIWPPGAGICEKRIAALKEQI